METDPAKVAAGLTAAQRKVLVHGFQARDNFATVEALIRRGLMARRACFPDGNGLPTTPLGLAVRDILMKDGGQ